MNTDLYLIYVVLGTHWRVTPHFDKKAEGFNEEQLAAILDLDFQNYQDLQALACVFFTCFTGIRIKDLHQANTAYVTRTASSTKNPRNWKIQLLKTKNDPDGTGPLENRTWIIHSCCLIDLEKEAKQSFAIMHFFKSFQCYQLFSL